MSDRCFHCHESVPSGLALFARVHGALHPVCCPGCKAAAEWIENLGLADYYRLRSDVASRPREAQDYAAWDRAALARLHVRTREDGRAEVALLVDGIRCAGCAWLIQRALGESVGVREIAVNAPARRVHLVYDPAQTRLSELLEGLARLGYAPHPLTAEAIDSLRQREARSAMKRLAVAGLGAMQAMMYAVALYAGVFDGIDPAVRDFFRWLGFLVATPVVLYSARPFFAGALREWRTRRLSMDTPVALAIALIYVASAVETLRQGHEIYFDSVSMFVFFLLLGRTLEMRARHRSGDVVDALAQLQPALAERVLEGRVERVGVHELEPGDVVRVAAGAAIPADGILCSRLCRIDESLLSGESRPRVRATGEDVIAGSIALEGPIDVRVRRIGSDTVLAGIVRLVARAGSERPQLARSADAHATRFVLRVFAATVVTALAWLAVDPARAFSAALAVLVVSCPCAFALAVPTALTRAISVLARRGVLVVKADALETLARADRIVFDKTGTLTRPAIDVAAIETRRGTATEALAVAAALEQTSMHPLAHAVREAAADLSVPVVEAPAQIAGGGVAGRIGGVDWRLGRAAFAGLTDDDDALLLADQAGLVARLPVRERLLADAREAVTALTADGVVAEIASGDHAARVADAAQRLGIGVYHAACTPEGKLARIAELQRDGHVVAMVGDGLNDAPVLAGADVAIAIGEGAALAQASSDVLIADGGLAGLPLARRIATDMLRAMRWNLRWALGYNLAVIPLAALGFVPPWLAAIGMSASSLVVILRSLRIGRDEACVAPTASASTIAASPIVRENEQPA